MKYGLEGVARKAANKADNAESASFKSSQEQKEVDRKKKILNYQMTTCCMEHQNMKCYGKVKNE